jgi:hypothetical protein
MRSEDAVILQYALAVVIVEILNNLFYLNY